MQEARVGLVLDNRYRIEERIAAGGTGVVYRGTRVGLDKSVAIKFLHQSGVDSPSRLKRFRREAEAMSRLTHPSLATIIDFGSHEGVPYLVMEFYEGMSLRSALESGPLHVPRAIDIIRQILAGLASAHDVGVVHRDLKPANVLLILSLGNEHVKILDFGVAKLIASEGRTEVSVTSGEPQGTPQYMSPEQARGQPITNKTDVYAAGILLYEMVTGQRPFDKGVGFAVLRQQVEDDPQPPRELTPSISAELEAVILKAMAKKPQQRFQSAALMAMALGAVPEVEPRQRRAKKATRARRGLRLLTLMVALIGSLAFAGWYGAENRWFEVPGWSPWQPSFEPPSSAARPPPARVVASSPDASAPDAPQAPPLWKPAPASVALGESQPRATIRFAKLRGTVTGRRFVSQFARLSIAGGVGTLSIADAPPDGDPCEASLQRALEIALPRDALIVGSEAANRNDGAVFVVDESDRRKIKARWKLRLVSLDASAGVAAASIQVRSQTARLRGKLTAVYCPDPRDSFGRRPVVNGVEWNPDQPVTLDYLPHAAVAGASGSLERHPAHVSLTGDSSRLTLSFFDKEPDDPCAALGIEGSEVVVHLEALDADTTVRSTTPRASFHREGSSTAATTLALKIDAIDSLGARGRIALAAADRSRSLLVGAFLARDCRH